MCKNNRPKIMKVFFLAPDIRVSDPKLAFFDKFHIFKLLVKYEDTPVTKIFCLIITGGKIHIL